MTSTLYKGAGPSTHWHVNDARLSGFTSAASRVITRNAFITHITNYSHPSPFLSFTTSYEVAREYALLGPGGSASSTNPGYVYEIDCLQVNDSPEIFNVLKEISDGHIAHGHQGNQKLISDLAKNKQTIGAVRFPGGKMCIPTISQDLKTLINAIRDAEVLIKIVPKNCVIERHDVF